MRDMLARELEDPLAPKRMLERLFAYGAFAANKGSLASRATTICRCRHYVIVDTSDSSRDVANARPYGAG